MAENTNYIGVAMGMDVTDLKAGLSEANKQIQLANSKFKAAASGMDDWTKSTEGLTAKVKQLDDVLKAQKSKLAGLKAEYEKVVAEQGEGSEAARKLQVEINNQQAVVNKTERELKNYSETLEKAEKGEIDLSDVVLKSGKAIEKAGKQSKDAADDVKELGDKAEDAGDGFTVAKGALAGFVANGLTSLVGGIKNGISSLLGLAESTKELRTNMAKLETSFTTAGHSAEDATSTYKELYGILGDDGQATEAAAHLAQLTDNQEDLSKWTNIATGVYATFGDSLPIEGLTEAANETAKTGQLTGGLADALNWAGVSEDEFQAKLDAASSEQERQALITDTLNGLYSEQADKFREVNGEVIEANKAESDLNSTTAELGAKIAPLTAKFTELKTKALQWFIDTGLPALETGWGWVKDNLPTVAIVVGGLTAAIVANKIATLAATAATEGLTLAQYAAKAAQNALNGTMLANPISLIILAITALVTAFITLWNNCEAFREFWINLWEGIKTAAAAVADWFVTAWDTVIGWFKDIWGALDISEAWNKLKNGAKNAWEGIKNTFSKVGSFFGNTFRQAWQKVKDVFSTGGKIFDGIKEGIVTSFKTVVNAIIKGINKVVKLPFEGLNKILEKIYKVKIAGIKPFSWLTWRAPIPELPELYRGGILKKGQVGILEGKGDEAVIPLEKNLGWIKKIAKQLSDHLALDVGGVKDSLSSLAYAGATGGRGKAGSVGNGGYTVVNAGMTVNYNGNLSRKELKKIETDHYKSVKTKLKQEGAIK